VHGQVHEVLVGRVDPPDEIRPRQAEAQAT
jgi:hypothetical protein